MPSFVARYLPLRALAARIGQTLLSGSIPAARGATVDGPGTTGNSLARSATSERAAAGLAARHEIVFIDGHVRDYAMLARALPPASEVVVLDPALDGVAQMARYLDGRHGLDSLQVISHGRDGKIQLGSAWLESSTLDQHREDLARIGFALRAHGDILFYGCEVAMTASGRGLVNTLASATRADLAASETLVGNVPGGGSWNLAYATGPIESRPLLDEFNVANYPYTLALSPGDLAIFGWNSVGPNNRVGLVVLKDIAAGTVVTFTDHGWMDVANGGPGFNSGNTTGDGKIVWTVGSTVAAGTVLTMKYNGSSSVTFTNITTGANLTGDVVVTGNSVADPLPTSGDQFLIYDANDSSPTFVFGLNNSASGTVGSNGWNTSIQLTSTDSLLPTGLTNGTNAIGFVTPHLQNVQYNGPTTGTTPALWLARLATVSNWTGDSNTGLTTSAISITGGSSISVDSNQSPVVTASGGTVAFTEGANVTSTPVVVDSGVATSDADSPTLASGTVSITGGLQASEDVLSFTNNPATMDNISGAYTAGTGILALTSSGATATVAQWQAALRSVTYTNSSDAPNTSSRTISFAVNDGVTASATSTKTVSVTAVNDAPIVTASGGTTAFTP